MSLFRPAVIFASRCRKPASLQMAVAFSRFRLNEPTPRTVYKDPVRQVFLSQSNDVFTNLALEDWLYRNYDFDHKSLLLLWRNNPCVVIGRHQNPWTEANVPYIRKSSAKLARRNSGGGTVYHDLGNLNCTFFTKKSDYHRRRNLDIVSSAIQSLSNRFLVAVNDRDDIILCCGDCSEDARKISGTAAKLGKNTAYHHCTVLVDVNACLLHDCLDSKAHDVVESRATQSLRVPVNNLKRADPTITTERLIEALGWQFLRTNYEGLIVDKERLGKQRGFQCIRPDERWFPGLDDLRKDFESHEWIFNKTPKFRVKKTFPVPAGMDMGAHDLGTGDGLEIVMEVKNGKVDGVSLLHGSLKHTIASQPCVSGILQGLPFEPSLSDHVKSKMDVDEPLNRYVADCIFKMLADFA